MSYECCQRISVNKKKNEIKVCIASNNVFPKNFHTCEYASGKYYKDYSFEDKLISLFVSMQNGSIQITSLNDNTEKFEYAMRKVRKWLRENNIDSYNDLYEKKSEVVMNKKLKIANIESSKNEDKWERDLENGKLYREWANKQDEQYITDLEEKIYLETIYEVYGKAFEIWKKALEESIKGDYKVKYGKYYEISKLGRYDRGYNKCQYTSLGKGLKMSYKRAYILVDDMGNGRDMEIIKVEG